MKVAREFVSEIAEYISMPEVYVSIRRLLLNPKSTIDDFVEVVKGDSMLAVRVMRMARSEYFGLPRACDNLHQAIGLIGLMQLHDLMLGSLCMRTFSSTPAQILNLEAFWRYCVQCGITARAIGEYGKIGNPHAFFTLGLLHEIGHAALFLKAPEASIQALDDSQNQDRHLTELEQEYLGFDYAQVGFEMMRLWHLPPIYQQVAEFHLQPQRADDKFRPAVAVVHLAHQLCQDPLTGKNQQIIADNIKSAPELAQLPDNIEQIIKDQLDAHTDIVLGLLWPCGAQDLESETYFQINN